MVVLVVVVVVVTVDEHLLHNNIMVTSLSVCLSNYNNVMRVAAVLFLKAAFLTTTHIIHIHPPSLRAVLVLYSCFFLTLEAFFFF
jgi:hypothetical protein